MQFHRSALLAIVLLGTCQALYAQEPAAHLPALQGFLFGDVVYQARQRASNDGFLVGQMVGHGNARLSERVSFFGEFTASARPDSYAFEVERAILRYDFADQLKISVGRYHTPISYWNTAYHHGLWLQTSVARPEIIKVGGRFMPVHFVGAMAEGTLSGHALSFSYEAGIGNGRGANVARAGDAGDLNRRRAAVLSARVRPGDLGLQIGGSMYFDHPTPAGIGISYDERITTGHIVWDRGAPELIAEYANVRHEESATGTDFSSNGWYAHFGYRLPGALSQWKPYARFERLDADAGDLAFGASLEDYRAWVGGLRFDFDALAALKAEYRRERLGASPAVNGLYLQVAFAVPLSGGM
ncbi:MAG TPA: hypothetical protein VF021_07775 [Longimicrobiales bacterium]